jgi:hypothetical protein
MGGGLVGEAMGGAILAVASLPVIGVVLVVGSVLKLRPAWAVGVGGVIAVVFATTLYNKGQPLVGPGVVYWWVAAAAGLFVLGRR